MCILALSRSCSLIILSFYHSQVWIWMLKIISQFCLIQHWGFDYFVFLDIIRSAPKQEFEAQRSCNHPCKEFTWKIYYNVRFQQTASRSEGKWRQHGALFELLQERRNCTQGYFPIRVVASSIWVDFLQRSLQESSGLPS